jgi:hypothetical protein
MTMAEVSRHGWPMWLIPGTMPSDWRWKKSICGTNPAAAAAEAREPRKHGCQWRDHVARFLRRLPIGAQVANLPYILN